MSEKETNFEIPPTLNHNGIQRKKKNLLFYLLSMYRNFALQWN